MDIDHCKTFTGLGNYLKEQAARTDLKQAECKQLYGTLEERCQHHYLNGLLSEYRNWYICEGASAVYTYLYRNWSYQSSLKANRGYLLEIADHLQQDYFCADGPQITTQEITHILSILDKCYDFSKKVLGSALLYLLLPNDAHRTYDALCRPYATPNGQLTCDIILPHVQRDTKTNPGSILLHELGHLLNLKLTGSLLVLPELFVQLDGLMRTTQTTDSTEELSELFAHLFAMTMLRHPELKQYDSYPPLPEDTQAVFTAYFQTLLARL
ncbi:hypothetical protein [Anaerotruncus rubiinfantis]|uniref:hypothetical protein n=1 Tax=Anaerotruncus rubiinfantis TaxID=1720200 RepID=UPI00082E74AB|nr:hypothetical protein [Anaerotruncus rubiinfantis]